MPMLQCAPCVNKVQPTKAVRRVRKNRATYLAPFSRDREVIKTCAPCLVSSIAEASPRPVFPPVTIITFPVRSGMSAADHGAMLPGACNASVNIDTCLVSLLILISRRSQSQPGPTDWSQLLPSPKVGTRMFRCCTSSAHRYAHIMLMETQELPSRVQGSRGLYLSKKAFWIIDSSTAPHLACLHCFLTAYK